MEEQQRKKRSQQLQEGKKPQGQPAQPTEEASLTPGAQVVGKASLPGQLQRVPDDKETMELKLTRAVEYRRLITSIIAKNITPNDAILFGTKPGDEVHLKAQFCRWLLGVARYSIQYTPKEIRFVPMWEGARDFLVLFPLVAIAPDGTTITAQGVSSSRQKFFLYRTEKDGHNWKQVEKELEQRDISAIVKTAESNAFWRLVKNAFGLSLTIGDLQKQGVDTKKFTTIEFGKKRKPQGRKPDDQKEPPEPRKAQPPKTPNPDLFKGKWNEDQKAVIAESWDEIKRRSPDVNIYTLLANKGIKVGKDDFGIDMPASTAQKIIYAFHAFLEDEGTNDTTTNKKEV